MRTTHLNESFSMNVLRRLKAYFFGDMTPEDLLMLGLLGTVAFMLIGTYSMMRPLKEVLFMRIVGPSYLPEAKILSFIVMIPLTLMYNELVDLVRHHHIFYIISGVYSILFFGIAFTLATPGHGLDNTTAGAGRIIGWVIYIGIESFIMLMLAVFWSFVSSVNSTQTAQRTYPLIIALAQIGSILGPESIKRMGLSRNMPILMLLVGCSMLMIIGAVKLMIIKRPQLANLDIKEKPTGAIEGLRLLLSRPYLVSIVIATLFYTTITAILEYMIALKAHETYHSFDEITAYFANLVQATNMIALVFSLVGSSALIRFFGVKRCLILFPALIGSLCLMLTVYQSLAALTIVMMLNKGLSYALNKPCTEMMYIPTSKDIKFKAKSWIDGFGYRGSFALGSSVNRLLAQLSSLTLGGPVFAAIICSAWVFIARFQGKAYHELVDEKKILS